MHTYMSTHSRHSYPMYCYVWITKPMDQWLQQKFTSFMHLMILEHRRFVCCTAMCFQVLLIYVHMQWANSVNSKDHIINQLTIRKTCWRTLDGEKTKHQLINNNNIQFPNSQVPKLNSNIFPVYMYSELNVDSIIYIINRIFV